MHEITIVTISYNQAKFLRACIDSVLSQGVDVQYIVVDPGSTDGSRDIIRSYGESVECVFDKDNGPADGLNKGFALANAPILGFLNSDDLFQPGALRTVVDFFKENSTIDMVTGAGQFVDTDGRRLRGILPSRFSPWLYAQGAVSVFQQGTFFRSRSFRAVPGFNIDNRTCWDGELFLDMCMAGAKCALIPSELACFRLHPASITGSNRMVALYQQDSERLFKKAMGRERNSYDRVLRVVALLLKHLGTPSYTAKRLYMLWQERS